MRSLRPADAATVMHRLTSFLFVATIIIGLAMTADTVIGGGRDVSFPAYAPLNDRLIPKGVDAIDPRTTISIKHPTAREYRLALAADLLPLLLALPVLWLLRGVAGSVRDGDPFGARNVRRLRAIGVLLVVGVPALQYATAALQSAMADPYLSSPFEPFSRQRLLPVDDRLYFPTTALLCGLGAFVLAQVFAHGVRLREDVDATI
jgi:Protein of unknown function (DUF2975)